MRRVAYTLGSLILILASACSHSRPQSEPQTQHELADSEVEINYGLGHTHRKLLIRAQGTEINGKTLVDQQILRENKVETSRYQDFFRKTSEFFEKYQRTPAADLASCRMPFTLTLRVGIQSRALKGCRSGEDGALGRLVRDGEFLLYSKK